MNKQQLQFFAWGLSALTVLLAVYAWGDSFSWQFARFSLYRLFPLFGLLAFGLMWAHYIVAVTRLHFKLDKAIVSGYFELTSFVVLLALILHPGLLIWQLWRDGLGLPPGSYINNYVAPGLGWVALLGTVSVLVFYAYELRRLHEERSWWKYVQIASDIAIVAVFYHGLRLGMQLQDGWFRIIWFGYGLTLVLALGYIYYRKLGLSKKPA